METIEIRLSSRFDDSHDGVYKTNLTDEQIKEKVNAIIVAKRLTGDEDYELFEITDQLIHDGDLIEIEARYLEIFVED